MTGPRDGVIGSGEVSVLGSRMDTNDRSEELRIFPLEDAEPPTRIGPPPSVVDSLCDAFTEATGWRLAVADRSADEDGPGVELAPSNESALDSAIELQRARRLAQVLSDVLSEWGKAQRALRRREAELAAGIPITVHRDEQTHLADRLASLLQGMAEMLECQAAAVYLLDETTSVLKLRASWGLPEERFAEEARPLRGAVADLEALVGHAVVLEDTRLLPHWRPPEQFAAAVCVPIATTSEPLGTLWVFSDKVRDFTADQTHLMEIVAGRIATELEREMLLHECLEKKQQQRALERAGRWQDERLPTVEPLVDDWEVAGSAGVREELRSGFFDWFVPPDGSLAATVGRGEGAGMEAALTAAALHGAVRAHADHRHNATDMLNRLNETLWNSSAGGQFASLCYLQWAPGRATVDAAGAGDAHLVRWTEDGLDWVQWDEPPLGAQWGDVYWAHSMECASGEGLLAWCGASGEAESKAMREALSRVMPPASDESLDAFLDRVRRAVHDALPDLDMASLPLLAVRRR